MPNLGGWEIVAIVVLIFLLFGARKLPEAARGLGRSLRIFKAEIKDPNDEEGRDAAEGLPPVTTQQIPPTQVQPVLQQPVVPQPIVQPVAQQPMVQQPMVQQPVLQQPLGQPPVAQPVIPQEAAQQAPVPAADQVPAQPTSTDR